MDSEIDWSFTGRRLGGAPVEFGRVTVHPDARARVRDRLRRPRRPTGATRSRRGWCWPATRSPRRPDRCSRGARRASTCPTRVATRRRRSASDWPSSRSRSSTPARSSAPRRPRRRSAQHHGLAVQPLPGVIEADYGEWTGGKIVGPGQDRPLEDGAARAVARAVPRRRVAGRDADAHGQPRWKRSSRDTRASWWSSCRTPTRSRPRSRTTPACTSTCSSASWCRRRRSRCSSFGRTAPPC